MKKPVDEDKLNIRAKRVLRSLQAFVIATIALVVILLITLLSLYSSGLLSEDSPVWGVNLLIAICCAAVAVVVGLFVSGVWAAILSGRLRKIREARAKAAEAQRRAGK
ncbi:MAG: hypothetical protein LUE27_07625 [Clostridia bacterium]|nr:hypothetical protein [Clostridia bacterium]